MSHIMYNMEYLLQSQCTACGVQATSTHRFMPLSQFYGKVKSNQGRRGGGYVSKGVQKNASAFGRIDSHGRGKKGGLPGQPEG